MTSDVLGHESLFTHMVRSSRNEMPHFVSAPKQFTGQFICDSHYSFVSQFIEDIFFHCSPAAAEVNRLLSMLGQFMLWFNKSLQRGNFTKLSDIGIPVS